MNEEQTAQLQDELTAAYRAVFPHGWISFRLMPDLGRTGRAHWAVYFGVLQPAALLNNIPQNDVSYNIFSVDVGAGEAPECVLDHSVGGKIMLRGETNYIRNSAKVPFRKVKGDIDGVVKGFRRYLEKLSVAVRDHVDELDVDIPRAAVGLDAECECCNGHGYVVVTDEKDRQRIEACDNCDGSSVQAGAYALAGATADDLARGAAVRDGWKLTRDGYVKG